VISLLRVRINEELKCVLQIAYRVDRIEHAWHGRAVMSMQTQATHAIPPRLVAVQFVTHPELKSQYPETKYCVFLPHNLLLYSHSQMRHTDICVSRNIAMLL
jgi:hypothetical protein